jgi:glycosyltransferase involved in cell wall biosynthesis
MSVIALIPCLNEEASITETISSLRKTLPDICIVVIDNGSTDSTIDKALNAGAIVRREPRKGKGFAVQTGFNSIPDDAEAIFMVDGDATYGLENLKTALEMIEKLGFDMVVGNRKTDSRSTAVKSYRRGHRLGNWALTKIYQKLFGIKLEDTLSGWRLMSVPFIKSFPGSVSSFEIEAELNVHAYNLSSSVGEVECSYRERVEGSASKLNTFKDGWLILKRNISLYKSERPSVAFNFLALPWLLTSAALISLPVTDYINSGQVARFPSLIAGVGAFIISTNLWVTGMILERVRLQRVAQLKFRYSDFLK